MSATISLIGKTVATSVAKKFGGKVVERWTRYRADRFFEGFAETVGLEVSTGVQSEEVDQRLDAILSDETKSEVLFDAYRRVCFSKSKTIGPRIIGLLTGLLVIEGRMANHDEERVFEAAELLADGDFIEFMKSYQKHRKKAEGISEQEVEHHMLGDSVVVRWLVDSSDSSSPSPHKFDIGPFPWEDAFGRWAFDLWQSGLMEARIQQTDRPLSSTTRGRAMTSMTVITMITFYPGCALLLKLLLRSLGPETSIT
jgi:hypothetical protein